MSRRITVVLEGSHLDPDVNEALLEYLEDRVGKSIVISPIEGHLAKVISVEAESWTQSKVQVTSQQVFG